ncbi:F0F1 ATP synthase subunit A [Mycoplasmatota bacterium]|nr:F0F1 ATP synthase subunit A [Mycoplasmatota bacterium]
MKAFLDNLISVLKSPPDYFISSLVIMGMIVIFSLIVGFKIKRMNPKDKPGKFMSLIIGLIDGFNKFVKSTMGKHWRMIAPIILSFSLYILISNISGVTGLQSTPTKYSAITFSLSIIAVFVIQMTGFVSKGLGHFKSVFEPTPFIAPLNIIGEITPIISLALRLFGNIASGALIISLIYNLTGWFSIIVAPIFHLIFDIAFGIIQTVVFVLLTLILSSTKIDEEDLDYV